MATKTIRLQGENERVLRSRARTLRVEGPAGTGKTMAILVKIHMICEAYPGARVLIVRARRTDLSPTVIPEYMELVGPGHPCHSSSKPENVASVVYPNGSRIIFGGLDEPDRIMGANYDLIWINEATVKVHFSAVSKLLSRFRGAKRTPYRQLILDFNPVEPSHWCNTWEATSEDARVVTTHRDNPVRYDWAIQDWTEDGRVEMATLASIPDPAERARKFEGRWVAREGAIFNLELGVHDLRVSDFPNMWRDWTKIAAVDWGIAAPFAGLLIGLDKPSKTALIGAECYRAGLSTPKQVQLVGQMLATGRSQDTLGDVWPPELMDYAALYYDPAMDNNGPRQADGAFGEPPIREYQRRLKRLVAGDNRSRLQNLGFLRQMIDAARSGEGDQWRLYIDREACPNTWREFEGAVWRQDRSSGLFVEDTDDPDHAITAAYYGLRSFIGVEAASGGSQLVNLDAVHV